MRSKKIRLFLTSLTSFGFLFLWSVMLSKVAIAVSGEKAGPESIQGIFAIVDNIAMWFQYIVLVIGVIMIIAAGLTWMTAVGNEEKLVKARKMLIWGLIGIAVALFAYAAKTFMISLLAGR